MKMIYFFEGKSKNRRVNLYLIQDPDGILFFHVVTKRLINKVKREITSTSNIYTYATFRSICEMMSQLLGIENFNTITKKYVDEMKADNMKVKTNIYVA